MSIQQSNHVAQARLKFQSLGGDKMLEPHRGPGAFPDPAPAVPLGMSR